MRKGGGRQQKTKRETGYDKERLREWGTLLPKGRTGRFKNASAHRETKRLGTGKGQRGGEVRGSPGKKPPSKPGNLQKRRTTQGNGFPGQRKTFPHPKGPRETGPLVASKEEKRSKISRVKVHRGPDRSKCPGRGGEDQHRGGGGRDRKRQAKTGVKTNRQGGTPSGVSKKPR